MQEAAGIYMGQISRNPKPHTSGTDIARGRNPKPHIRGPMGDVRGAEMKLNPLSAAIFKLWTHTEENKGQDCKKDKHSARDKKY